MALRVEGPTLSMSRYSGKHNNGLFVALCVLGVDSLAV